MKRKNAIQRTVAKNYRKSLFEAVESRTFLSVSTPTGLTPIEVRNAYGFSQITFTNSSGQTITGNGAGQTIAIVDPYNATTIDNDLDTFDKTFSFDSSGQTLYQEFGAANSFLSIDSLGKGESSTGWALEVALDVEWAHAIAPAANIDLVEANSASTNDLLSAVKTAADLPGVSVVSMSWGGTEARNESTFDSAFTTPSGHTGVTFVAAAGDSGAGAEWPAVSPNVISVGGTSLNVSSTGTYISESAWSDGGGGLSEVESEPSYQDGVNSTGLRSTPDVSYDANPNTGFSVYTSVKQGGQTGWFTVGGTSAGAPQWSALVAIADQGRTIAGETNLDGKSQTLPYLYEMPASAFHDITSGSNGYRATTGYDMATGLGTPIASAVVSNLVTPPTSTSSGSGSGSSGSGSSGSGSGGSNNGGGFGNGGNPGFPGFPSRFHIPGRFANHFRPWDVAETQPANFSTANHTAGVTNPAFFATTSTTNSATTGTHAAIDSLTDTSLLGSAGNAGNALNITAADIANHTIVSGIAPFTFIDDSSLSIPLNADSSSENLTHTFSSISPTAIANESLQNIFSTQSAAANVTAVFSSTLVSINEEGLKAAILVLPLIAFWAYQSRLAKSRDSFDTLDFDGLIPYLSELMAA